MVEIRKRTAFFDRRPTPLLQLPPLMSYLTSKSTNLTDSASAAQQNEKRCLAKACFHSYSHPLPSISSTVQDILCPLWPSWEAQPLYLLQQQEKSRFTFTDHTPGSERLANLFQWSYYSEHIHLFFKICKHTKRRNLIAHDCITCTFLFSIDPLILKWECRLRKTLKDVDAYKQLNVGCILCRLLSRNSRDYLNLCHNVTSGSRSSNRMDSSSVIRTFFFPNRSKAIDTSTTCQICFFRISCCFIKPPDLNTLEYCTSLHRSYLLRATVVSTADRCFSAELLRSRIVTTVTRNFLICGSSFLLCRMGKKSTKSLPLILRTGLAQRLYTLAKEGYEMSRAKRSKQSLRKWREGRNMCLLRDSALNYWPNVQERLGQCSRPWLVRKEHRFKLAASTKWHESFQKMFADRREIVFCKEGSVISAHEMFNIDTVALDLTGSVQIWQND